jgi:hypothetical protein
MAPNRTIPSRQPTGRDTLAAPIGILPRREGRPGESTPFSYGIAATVSARVRDTREGQAPRPPPVGIGGTVVRQNKRISYVSKPIFATTYNPNNT